MSPDEIDKEPERRAGKDARRAAKQQRREARALDPWQRYRALADSYELAQDLLEFADRKVRFGLIVIGALNLMVFGAALRTDAAAAVPPSWRPWVILALASYAVVLFKGVSHALSALRPRINPIRDRPNAGRGLHFYDDVLARPIDEYDRSWRELPMGELCTQMAEQGYALAHINRAKFQALGHMYGSIRAMLTMGVAFLVFAAFVVFARPSSRLETAGAPAAGETDLDSREYKLMLRPERFGDTTRTVAPDAVSEAIRAFWRLAAPVPGFHVDFGALERGLAGGPVHRRLLHFLDAPARAADTCRPAQPSAFLFECRELLIRSRVDVKPHAPGTPFEIDDRRAHPVELTVKSRSTTTLVRLPERQIQILTPAGVGPLDTRRKVEKDMTVGRTTWGQSSSVRMTAPQAKVLFKGAAPQGPGIGVPADFADLGTLFAVPALGGVENRPLVAVPMQIAYEEVWSAENVLVFPRDVRAAMTLSLWYDIAGALRVAEASWRLQTPVGGSLAAEAVGASEQLLDRLAHTAAQNGWFDAEATLKKAHALEGTGE